MGYYMLVVVWQIARYILPDPTRSLFAALHGSQVGLIWMAIARDAETNSVTEQVMVGKIWQNHLAMENPQF